MGRKTNKKNTRPNDISYVTPTSTPQGYEEIGLGNRRVAFTC